MSNVSAQKNVEIKKIKNPLKKKMGKRTHIWQQSMIEKQENCYLDMRVKGKSLVNWIQTANSRSDTEHWTEPDCLLYAVYSELANIDLITHLPN